jgi:hypothetical protein
VKLSRWYLGGLGAIISAAAAVGLLLPARARPGFWAVVVLAALVQGPLGWWLLKSVGTPSVLPVWSLGLLARVGLVAITGLLLVPTLGWPAQSTLIGLVVVLLAALFLEATVLAFEHHRSEAR